MNHKFEAKSFLRVETKICQYSFSPMNFILLQNIEWQVFIIELYVRGTSKVFDQIIDPSVYLPFY